MKYRPILCLASLLLLPLCAFAQTLDPEAFHRPPTDTWPTYNGDYSGRRYSTLSQINASNVNIARAGVDASCRFWQRILRATGK